MLHFKTTNFTLYFQNETEPGSSREHLVPSLFGLKRNEELDFVDLCLFYLNIQVNMTSVTPPSR